MQRDSGAGVVRFGCLMSRGFGAGSRGKWYQDVWERRVVRVGRGECHISFNSVPCDE